LPALYRWEYTRNSSADPDDGAILIQAAPLALHSVDVVADLEGEDVAAVFNDWAQHRYVQRIKRPR